MMFKPAQSHGFSNGARPDLAGGFYRVTDRRWLNDAINQQYDLMMYAELVDDYYDHSGFQSFGFWTPTTHNQREASENLVDVLLEMIPNKSGSILDIACGMGGSTQRLLRYYRPSNIIGISISEEQLAACRRRVPGVHFLSMDATDLQFLDNSFENILCIEAACYFDTREQFLREAYRVLKPGGCLALSDILLRSRQVAALAKRIPLANFHPDSDSYRISCEQCGFLPVQIAEARAECWEGFRKSSLTYLWNKAVAGEMPWAAVRRIARSSRFRDWMSATTC